MQRTETPDSHSRSRAMLGLAAFVVGVGVVSWLVSGGIGRPHAIAKNPPSSFPILPDTGSLNGVTCVSADDCWAVGAMQTRADIEAGTSRALIEHYKFSRWAIVSSAGPLSGYLAGVTCVTAEDCWAVGGTTGSSPKPLIEHYSGTRWVIIANSGGSQLTSVTCISAQDCWAVGSTTTPPTGVSGTNAATSWPLIEHYKFSRWAIVGTAHPLPGQLIGVTCVSAGDCWAAGGTAGNPPRPLIEHYVTGNWAVDPSYSPSLAQLYGVTCVNAEDCWAVGGPADRSPLKTLIEHYTGTTWDISVNTPGSALYGVTCVSAEDCWAVGAAHNVSGRERLTEHYTGGSWAEDNAPEPVVFVEGDYLFVMTCVSAADCWAVGSAQGINGFQVLIEHYALGKWLVITGPNLGP